ncbi:MAG TPA: beta-phosphoglucomutase family hydrolase [Capillimicrobium sp.]|nr:beta-phosphoglucomutase family hydrolase [Capillimicrobium sp.]
MLGLPDPIAACLFDLDGVLTRTAVLHAEAWKATFDEFLAQHGQQARPFDPVSDYNHYVDGRPRLDGVRAFLAARQIELPEGSPDDPPGAATLHGLANAKNDLVLRLIRERGVEVYPGSVRFVDRARRSGLRCAVVSSSSNCRDVLVAAGIERLFEVRIDGLVVEREGLAGKPAPDTFLAAARALGVPPARGAVFEDALAGVQAGRAGSFGYVVGVDRTGHADELRRAGADLVVCDLADLLDSA